MSGSQRSPSSVILPSASMSWPLSHPRRRRRPRLQHLRTPPSDAILYVILSAWPRVDLGPFQRANAPSRVLSFLRCQLMARTWRQTHLTFHAFPAITASAATPRPELRVSMLFGAFPARAPCHRHTAGRQPVPQSITTRVSRLRFCHQASAAAAAASAAPPRPADAPPTPLPVTCLTWARCAWRPSSTVTPKRSIVRVARRLLAPGTSARLPATGAMADVTTTRPRSMKASFLFAPIPSAASKPFFISFPRRWMLLRLLQILACTTIYMVPSLFLTYIPCIRPSPFHIFPCNYHLFHADTIVREGYQFETAGDNGRWKRHHRSRNFVSIHDAYTEHVSAIFALTNRKL